MNMRKQSESEQNFGHVIQMLRSEKKMSIHDLAKQTGISASYIARIESGERKNPSYAILEQLALGLGVTMEKFVNVLRTRDQE